MPAAQDVIICRVSPGEAEIIAAITTAAYTRYVPLLGRQPQPMTADYRQILAEHPVWLLYLGDRPSAYL